jgi:GAF domain-containing protein
MKEQQYQLLVEQVKALVAGETDATAILSNVSAALRDAFPERYFWVGFYCVKQGELVLGPFQGPVACYRIGLGKGVCGTAWQRAETVIVPDVEEFPGHIACSSLSRSEIVVPVKHPATGEVLAVLDIDSTGIAAFDEQDGAYLEVIAGVVAAQLTATA